MSEATSARIAEEILTTYGKEMSFDIDFMDQATSEKVAKDLEKLGCTVTTWSFKSALHVIPPRLPAPTKPTKP